MLRIVLLVVGFVSLALGLLGIALPVLPTTPFLLLTAYCFLRSNRVYYRRLLAHKVLGPYITNFIEHRAIPRRVKVYILLTLWLTIGLSAYAVDLVWVRCLLLVVAVGVSVHILRFKSR